MISRVGAAAASATTVTLPAHEPGDLILIYAYRDDAAAPTPTLPAGWAGLSDGGSGENSSRVAYRIAATDSEVSGTWTSADALIATVYRCAGRWRRPTVAEAGITSPTPVVSYPDLPASEWFVRFAGSRTATNMASATPDGWTASAAVGSVRAMDVGPVAVAAEDVGGNDQIANTTSTWRTATVGLSEATEPDEGTPQRDVWDKIPASATVLTVSGQTFNLSDDMPAQLQGVFAQHPYTVVKVDYPASRKSTTLIEGVANLNSALAAAVGPKIVVAHDLGAQVCSHWMAEHAADPAAPDPADLTFLLLGNPLRVAGGSLVGGVEVGGTVGVATPTGTLWPIVDVARRYDGFADWPGDTSIEIAVRNAKEGKSRYHQAYSAVDLFAPTHTVWTVGNTTFVLTAEALPMLATMTVLDDVESAIRAAVESAYTRPDSDSVIEAPVIRNMFWHSVLTNLGVSR